MKSNYPMPKPGQRNANSDHGTKPDSMRSPRGTMGTQNQGAKSGMRKR